MLNELSIIGHFYPENTMLRKMLVRHSMQVRLKALEIAEMPENKSLNIDLDVVSAGALLHDIGIRECDAPSILCNGSNHYLCHGIIGAEMLRDYGKEFNIDLEKYARICERHTGSGLTAKEIEQQGLPLPHKDFLPETVEEKLVCFADSFFSKSGMMEEKSVDKIRKSMMKFGIDTLERFDAMCELFHV